MVLKKMSKCFLDLDVGFASSAEKIKQAKELGWFGICLVKDLGLDFKSFVSEIEGLRKDSSIEILTGALISPKKAEDVPRLARSAVDVADLVLVSGGDEDVNRAASECWEVDILCHPERVEGRDFMDQKNSGLDDVCFKFLSERGIAVELNFSSILNSYGMSRAQIISRMRQNIMLAEKYGAPIIFTTGANDVLGMRTPRDLLSVLLSFGVEAGYAKKIMEYWPGMLVRKSVDRRNPNILLKGLEVVSQNNNNKTDRKRMYGWY